MTVAATSRFPGIRFRVAGKLTGGTLSTPAIPNVTISSTCWWDLSTRVTTLDCQLGSGAGPGDRLASGGAFTVNLLNTDRKLDRLNTGSSMYGKLPVGCQVWAQLNWAGTTYDLFAGHLDVVTPRLDPGGASWIELRGFDRLSSYLDHPIRPSSSTAGEDRWDYAWSRIRQTLWKAGYITGTQMNTLTAVAILDATTWGGTLASEITASLIAEGGESRVFCKRSGVIDVWGANTFREQTRSWVNQRTFSSKSSEVRYDDLTFSEQRDRIRTKAHVTRVNSTMGYEYASTTYVDLFGARSTSMEGVATAFDADARALPDGAVWRHRELIYSIDAVRVVPTRNPAVAWPSMLGMDIMDRVAVRWRTAVNRNTHVVGSTYALSGHVTGWHLNLDWPAQHAAYDVFLDSGVPIFSSTGGAAWLILGTSAASYKLGY